MCRASLVFFVALHVQAKCGITVESDLMTTTGDLQMDGDNSNGLCSTSAHGKILRTLQGDQVNAADGIHYLCVGKQLWVN